MLYLVIPNTDIQLYSGCVVIFNKYPEIRWVLHYGWCKYEETELFGWYFKSIPTNITVPAGKVDLNDLKIIDNPCPPIPPSPSEDQVPFTEELRDMVYASFITVQSLDELNTIDTSVVPDGKLVRVNNVDGSVVYYAWSLDQHEWVVADYVSVEEFNLLAEEVSEKQDALTPGANIQIEDNVISATDTTYENLPAVEDGQDVSLVTTGEKYNWNNKSDFSGSYNDLTDKPEIPEPNDGTLTIQANGTTLGTFTANDDNNVTVNITAADLGISAPMDFVGVSTTDPQGEDGATVSGHTTWLPGEVVIYQRTGESGYAEYVNIDGNNTSASWELLGDTESYALKSIQINAGTGLTGGGDLSQNRTLSLADAYGDTKNPYGVKADSNVLIAPAGIGGLPTFRRLTKSDLPPVLTVSDIKAISSADLEKLTIGDTVVQNTGLLQDILYVVSYTMPFERRLVNVSPSQITSVNYSKVLDWEYRGTIVFDVSTKQDTLVSGTNIKTINGNSILGDGNLSINTYQPFPNTWTTDSTIIAFCNSVNADTSAVEGMAYLGELYCSDLPFNGNADAVVEIIAGSGSHNKVIHITITSGNVAPYRWEYTYWNDGSSTTNGWIAFQNQLTAGKNITIDSSNIISATDIDSGDVELTSSITVTKPTGNYSAGDVIPAGTNIAQLLTDLLMEDINPVAHSPEVTLTPSGWSARDYEVGTELSLGYTCSLSPGYYSVTGKPNQTGGVTAKTYNITATASDVEGTITPGTSASGNLGTVTLKDGASVKLNATITGTQGNMPKTFLDKDYPSIRFQEDASYTKSTGIARGKRNYFVGYASNTTIDYSSALTSAVIRGAQLNNFNEITSITTNQMQEMFFAAPHSAGKTSVSVSNSYTGLPQDVKKYSTTVDVEGANGYTAIAYDVWYVKNASAESRESTFTITWS